MTCGRLLDLVQPEVDPHPENSTLVPHVYSALLAIVKLSQLKADILFPASRPYSLGTVGTFASEV